MLGGAAKKKNMDGVPDRDVIVTALVKPKQRPKHTIKKVAPQKISRGDPPPIYMKVGSRADVMLPILDAPYSMLPGIPSFVQLLAFCNMPSIVHLALHQQPVTWRA